MSVLITILLIWVCIGAIVFLVGVKEQYNELAEEFSAILCTGGKIIGSITVVMWVLYCILFWPSLLLND